MFYLCEFPNTYVGGTYVGFWRIPTQWCFTFFAICLNVIHFISERQPTFGIRTSETRLYVTFLYSHLPIWQHFAERTTFRAGLCEYLAIEKANYPRIMMPGSLCPVYFAAFA